MIWSFNSDRPIYAQIIEHIKLFIVSDVMKPGEKVLSVRELAQDAGVNPNTMQRALAELERLELMYPNRTSGRFITEDVNMIQQVKEELAEESIRNFLQNMKKIGFNKDEAVTLIQKTETGEIK